MSKSTERVRRWRAANPERVRETLQKWRQANPEKVREYNRRQREAKKAAELYRLLNTPAPWERGQ